MNFVDCGLFTIRFIHNMLILRMSRLVTFAEMNDYFINVIIERSFLFNNNDMDHLRKE